MDSTVDTIKNEKLFSQRSIVIMATLTVGYFLLSYVLIGFKPEQVFLMALVDALYFLSFKTRRFIKGFSIFIIYWVIFDYMKAFPNYLFHSVHIKDLYDTEKHVFGITLNGVVVTPNEYLLQHEHIALNIITGCFYLTWIPVPLFFAGYLFYNDKAEFYYFSCTFLLVNLLGFVIYYCYPAAPPWYIQQYGFVFHSHTPGNVAGLGRFDAYFHAGVFKSLYAKSSNVFAAMPSLHSSYPVIVLYYGIKNKLGWVNVFFGIVMVGIWFSAIYNSHHYVLDVLSGILCAIAGINLFNRVILKQTFLYNILQRNIKTIS